MLRSYSCSPGAEDREMVVSGIGGQSQTDLWLVYWRNTPHVCLHALVLWLLGLVNVFEKFNKKDRREVFFPWLELSQEVRDVFRKNKKCSFSLVYVTVEFLSNHFNQITDLWRHQLWLSVEKCLASSLEY